ncbi:MAG: hypothetical protein ACYTGX_12560 [Planctomycetota bacterium]|jgi:hypothetical protein
MPRKKPGKKPGKTSGKKPGKKPMSIRVLAAQMRKLESKVETLQAKRAQLLREVAKIDAEIAGITGGPVPKGAVGAKGGGNRGGKGKGLTDWLRGKVGDEPVAVAKLAANARRAGFTSGNLEQVIRLMVGKASDLKRNADDTVVKA